MRRTVAFALVLIMIIFPFHNVNAEETRTTILFRGIPWLVSIDEAVEKLDPYSLGVKGRLWRDEKMYSWGVDYTRVSSENAGFEYSVSDAANILFVAGHSVNKLELCALYGYTDDSVSTDPEDSLFYKGTYYFDDEDKLAAYEDLYVKLIDIYGTPSGTGEDDREKYAVWYRMDDTGVILRFNDFGIKYLSLSYGRADADDLILGLKEAFVNQNKGEGNGGYDGL